MSGSSPGPLGGLPEPQQLATNVLNDQQQRVEPAFQEALALIQRNFATPQVQGVPQTGQDFVQGAAKRSGGSAEAQQRAQIQNNQQQAQGGFAQELANVQQSQALVGQFSELLRAMQQLPLAQMGSFTAGADLARQRAANSSTDLIGLGQGLGTLGTSIYNRNSEPAAAAAAGTTATGSK